MPMYQYRCSQCGCSFEEFYSLQDNEGQKSSPCPGCSARARRVFTPFALFSQQSVEAAFSDDAPEYREMHYYEKKGDWERAAKAADGVSEFAKNKFLEKAKSEDS